MKEQAEKTGLRAAGIAGRERFNSHPAELKSDKNGTKRILFFKNEPEKLLILKKTGLKTNRNEPKNEAEKLLKTLECIKNEPERTGKRTGPSC